MLSSGGNSEAGTMAERCGRVSQEHNISNGKVMPHLPSKQSIFTAANLRAEILAKSSARSIINGSHDSIIVDQNGEVGIPVTDSAVLLTCCSAVQSDWLTASMEAPQFTIRFDWLLERGFVVEPDHGRIKGTGGICRRTIIFG
jgi:hypothetical protein